jgi:hypothetical protein
MKESKNEPRMDTDEHKSKAKWHALPPPHGICVYPCSSVVRFCGFGASGISLPGNFRVPAQDD